MVSAGSEEAGPGRGGAGWTLAAVCVPLFLVALNSTAVNTALPAIADELNTSTANLAWVVNAYLLATAAIVVLGGQFGDLFGRRRMFLVGIGLFVVSSVVIATGSSEVQLIAGRALQGAGAAFILPGSMSIIGDAFRGPRRQSAMGIWGAVAGLGFALGPVIGGVLTDTLGWEWVWWANLPIEAGAVVLILWAVRESRDESAVRSVDVPGLGTLAAGLFLVVLAINQGESWGWGDARTLGAFAAGFLLLAAFVLVERRSTHPIVHLEHLRSRAFVVSNLGTFVITLVTFGVLYLYNLYFQNFLLLDESAVGSGLLLLPLSGALFAVSLFVGGIVQRFGARVPLAVGFALQAAGLAWTAFATPDSGIGFFVGPLVVTGIGLGLTFAPTSAVGVSAVPDSKAGEASGVINVSRYLGGAIGIAVLTVLYTSLALGDLNDRLGTEGVGAAEERRLDAILADDQDTAERAFAALPAQTRGEFRNASREAVTEGFAAGNVLMAGLAGLTALACLTLLGGHRHPRHHHATHRATGPAAPIVSTSLHATVVAEGPEGPTWEAPPGSSTAGAAAG